MDAGSGRRELARQTGLSFTESSAALRGATHFDCFVDGSMQLTKKEIVVIRTIDERAQRCATQKRAMVQMKTSMLMHWVEAK